MKICIITHTFPRFDQDVAAPFMGGVADGIAENGNEVVVLSPFSPKFKKKQLDKKYKLITYKYAPLGSWHVLGYSETLTDDKSLKFSGYLLSPLMIFFGAVALYRLVRKERIDLINAHWILPNGFIASIVSILTGVPVVSTLPGSDVYMADKNNIFRHMARFASETSKAITSNSPQLLKDLADICEKTGTKRGRIQKKTSIIVYGVDPKKFYPSKNKVAAIRNKLKIPKNALLVTSVGRLVSKKGFRYLIEAAPAILKKKINVIFAIFGEGDQRFSLETLSKRLGVESHFLFPGWIKYSELADYQNLGDIFVLPSVRDEDGNLDDQSVSVVEAMACAKPIITTDFPGYRMVVKNGINGFLVQEKNSTEISRVIIKLVSSPDIRKKMGGRSRKLAVEKFSWQAIGKQYTDLFRTITK